jgi:ferredoxin-thioredoxin reductase catalytic chain
MAVKKLWRCNVCNDIHYGIKGPTICPTCGAKNAFTLIDYPEAKKVIIDRGDRLDQVDQLLAVWEKFAEGKTFKLNPDIEFVKTLARGELENQKNHGLKYCPCRITTGDLEEDLNLICPCNFFIQPVYRESGECWCGLFVKRD